MQQHGLQLAGLLSSQLNTVALLQLLDFAKKEKVQKLSKDTGRYQ